MHKGPSEDSDNLQHELRGIIPRTFEYLFNHFARQKELVCQLEMFTGNVHPIIAAAKEIHQEEE